MDAVTIAVHWHDENKPIYSLDLQPKMAQSQISRLVTGGGDNNVRIWKFVDNTVEYLSTLRKHTQAVNVVRFNSKGDVLATAGDDGFVFLWTKSDTIIKDLGDEDDEDMKESWQCVGNITIGNELVDLCWCNDYLAIGSMDNILRVYHVVENGKKLVGKPIHTSENNDHFIQGVAFSNHYLFTQSADRSIVSYKFDDDGSLSLLHKFQKLGSTQMYQSENLQSFFRRLSCSPDGSLLITPAGLDENGSNCVYIYSIANLHNGPVIRIGGFIKPAIIVSFNPKLYKSSSESSLLPYKSIFAIGTLDSIVVYSTDDNFKPLGQVSNIHYQAITDLTWDENGSKLLVSSMDGFCSVINFEGDVFGPLYENPIVDNSHSEKLQPQSNTASQSPPPKKQAPTIDTFFKDKKGKKRITPTLIS
ncbi:CAC2 [Candida margitis]|uniref:CAC2 n=1 Tax=Candida margitis TaxID=1775924 RepID=UPI002226D9E0|nr:CAC2 [Candida margitis]KAI5970272.1 CAC2 [Candida margitis]